jgi:hypothetical protein
MEAALDQPVLVGLVGLYLLAQDILGVREVMAVIVALTKKALAVAVALAAINLLALRGAMAVQVQAVDILASTAVAVAVLALT